jgi:hypothetical protein
MMRSTILLFALLALPAVADTGDPQLKTDHPWYPGELAFSTFERLFTHQTEVYKRVTGREVKTDEDKALASWLWRNAHYAHAEEGKEDLWGKGFDAGGDLRTREYWTGLFAHGFGLCGTTHSQYTAEMQHLLGNARGRGMGVAGHNSFEVFLCGGPYGEGRWALLDHDISTVIFSEDGSRLLSIPEIKADLKKLADRGYKPEKQRGWLVAGLHPEDAKGVFSDYNTAEYHAGYSGPPPIIRLRRGEKLRRYFQPGLEDGKTFVFWGLNYKGAVPGPERHQTWVNQPDAMYQSKSGTPYIPGQFRYGNAVYTYAPDFAGTDYREGVVEESPTHVVLEFYTPYIIGTTPANDKPWGIYDAGGRNGLVLRGKPTAPVSVSVDQGRTWTAPVAMTDGLDLTDAVKGRRQYWLKFGAGATSLSGLTITTVCQANPAVFPRLKDGGTKVAFEASGRGIVSAGPNLPQASARVVDGAFGSPAVALEVPSPRKEPIVALYAAAHVASGNPPRPDVKYQIEASTDGGATWKPVVKDWTIARRGEEPKGFWSQSLCYGAMEVKETATSARVRFSNSGGKSFLRGELHVVYRTPGKDATKATFDWTDDAGAHRESKTFAAAGSWDLKTGKNVKTRWVELETVK